jgi:hypothetical protein
MIDILSAFLLVAVIFTTRSLATFRITEHFTALTLNPTPTALVSQIVGPGIILYLNDWTIYLHQTRPSVYVGYTLSAWEIKVDTIHSSPTYGKWAIYEEGKVVMFMNVDTMRDSTENVLPVYDMEHDWMDINGEIVFQAYVLEDLQSSADQTRSRGR